jgi:hypothetical protein
MNVGDFIYKSRALADVKGYYRDQGDRNFYTPFFVHEKCMNGGLFRHTQHKYNGN